MKKKMNAQIKSKKYLSALSGHPYPETAKSRDIIIHECRGYVYCAVILSLIIDVIWTITTQDFL